MRTKPVQVGKKVRQRFAQIDSVIDMPNLLDVQLKSYKWLCEQGIREVLDDVSPIEDFQGKLVVEFVDYTIDPVPRYPVEECKERDVNYESRLLVTVRVLNRETGEVKQESIFMGNLPLMTDNGTFVINGAERVVVSQLVRSPGIYYDITHDKVGKELYASTVTVYS